MMGRGCVGNKLIEDEEHSGHIPNPPQRPTFHSTPLPSVRSPYILLLRRTEPSSLLDLGPKIIPAHRGHC